MIPQWKGLAFGIALIAFISVTILSGVWTLIAWSTVSSYRADIANSTDVLALVQAIGEREVVRSKVRRVEEYADVAWRDARGEVRRARVPLERERLVDQGGRQFYPLRYFEDDRDRRPLMMTLDMATRIIRSSEDNLYYGVLGIGIGALGFLAVFAALYGYLRMVARRES